MPVRSPAYHGEKPTLTVQLEPGVPRARVVHDAELLDVVLVRGHGDHRGAEGDG